MNKFLRYFIIGSLCGLIDYFIFFSCIYYFNIYFIYSNIFSSIIGMSLAFFLNIKLNFIIYTKLYIRLVYFYSVGIIGISVSSGLIYFLNYYNVLPYISKFLVFPVVFLIQFNLNKYLTFKT